MVHVAPLTIQAALGCRKRDDIAFITDAVTDGERGELLYAGEKMSPKEVYVTVNFNRLALTDSFCSSAPGRKAVVMDGTDTIAGSCTNMMKVCFHTETAG